MSTSTTLDLTEEQILKISIALRITKDNVPKKLVIIAVSPEATGAVGEKLEFSPTVIIT